MAATIDSIKTRKANQLNTQLNVYKEGKTQAIQKIKSGSVFNTDNQKLNANATASIFDNPALKGVSNQSAVAQTNDNQNTVSNSTSVNLSPIITKANDLINNVVQQFKNAIDNIKNSLAELSAMTAPQTSGQTVNPQENIPTDNKGSDNRAASGQDKQNNVTNGQETISDNTKIEENKEPEKKERESNIEQAQTSSEITKATLKEIDKQYANHYQMGTNGLDSIFDKIEDMTASAS